MKPQDLNHVLRAIDDIADPEIGFLLIGSQAILAHLDPEYFDAEVLFVSSEIDVAAMAEDKDAAERIADLIDGNFGELSLFDQTHGYHADGVMVETATLAEGWRDRLKAYHAPGVAEGRSWALSYADLAVSKLMAGRDKDLSFVSAMASIGHPDLKLVSNLLASLPESPNKEKAITRWKHMHGLTPVEQLGPVRAAPKP